MRAIYLLVILMVPLLLLLIFMNPKTEPKSSIETLNTVEYPEEEEKITNISVSFQFVKKVTIAEDAVFPGILFVNDHFYVTYTSVVDGKNRLFVREYDKDFNPTGFVRQLTNSDYGVEDQKIIYANGYFFIAYSSNLNRDLYLRKFDSNWNLIKEITVVLNASETDPTNDMFLSYINGYLYLGTTSHTKEAIPFFYQRVRKYDLDLNFVEEFTLDDISSECGGSLIFLNDTFIFISSDKFWGNANLIVLFYDSNWNFVDYKEISGDPNANERFPMGFAYKDGYFYVSYTHQTGNLFGTIKNGELSDDGNIMIKIFNKNWNLVGKINVTNDVPPNTANRAHLAVVDNKIYVAYDLEEEGRRKVFVKEYIINFGEASSNLTDSYEKISYDLANEKYYRFGIGAKMDEISTARLANILGLDWIRLESVFIWGNIEPSKEKFTFDEADALVREIEKYEVLMIGKFTSYAEWDCGPKEIIGGHIPSPPACKPKDMEGYKRFVRNVVERYDGDGIDDMPGLKYPIKYWTIGNEVEDHTFFEGSGKDYAEVLKASYEAIKEADPEAKVLISAAGDVKILEKSPFWEEVFLEDVENYFDYGNIHYNVGVSGIDEEGYEDLSKGFRYYKNLLGSYGIEGKKIFGTEISPAPDYLPEKEKARLWVIGSVKSFYEGAAGIKYPFVFEDEKMLKMFITMTTLLKHFEEVEKINEGCYKFYFNQSTVYVMWSPCEMDLEGDVYVVNIYGDIKSTSVESEFSNDPIYVTKDENKVRLLKEKINVLYKLKKELKEIEG